MIIDALFRVLSMAFAMGWKILWPLILGFALSAVVQAVVSHQETTTSLVLVVVAAWETISLQSEGRSRLEDGG